MTTFTNPHERIEQLMLKIERLERGKVRCQMTRVIFEKVSIGRWTRRWTENGKRRQETREFWQTINPFNKNEDGTFKGRMQILAELNAEVAVWMHAKELTQSQNRDDHGG